MFMTNHVDNNTVCKIDWFERNGVQVLDFSVGDAFTLLRVEDKFNVEHIYGLIHPGFHGRIDACFQGFQKEMFKNTLFKLNNLDATDVVSFDCGSSMSMIVRSISDPTVSIVPNREESSGLTHAFKDGSEWKFVP